MGGSAANLTHHFLIAMPTMADPRFSQTLTYVCEHNADGALGIVVNKPTEMTLSALFEQIEVPLADEDLRRTPVHFGGPVQVDRGFVLHRPLGNWQSTLAIDDDVGLTTSKDVLEAVARGEGPEGRDHFAGLRRLVGGQLEEEIAQNAWLTVAADPRRTVRHASRRTPARGDAAPRHRLLAVVRRCRARMTRGFDGTGGRGDDPRVRFRNSAYRRRAGNALTRIARPLTTIDREATAARFEAIASLIDEWRPDMLIVGRPLHADGSEHEMTERAERFARQLSGRFGLQVTCVDERFTTLAADSELAGAGVRGRRRKAARDAVAAQ
jgi:putative transcriptional regulator